MKVAVSQIFKQSAAAWFLTCLVASVAFAQVDPGSKLAQRNNPGPPPPLSVPVLVTNSSGQPVPTTAQGTTTVAGTVNVGNTPSVTVANTPSVTIANTPSVSVSGTPTVALSPGGSTGVTNPLDGQNNPTPLVITEGVQFYDDHCQVNFSGNYMGSCQFHSVPSGKQLVIQEFDDEMVVEPGNKPITTSLGGLHTYHYFTQAMTGSSGGDWYATHQPTRMYSMPGTPPYCVITLSVSSNGYAYCQVSGFLIDVP